MPLLVVLILVPALAWGAVSLLSRSDHPASDLVSPSASPSPEATEEATSAMPSEEPTEPTEPPVADPTAEPTQEVQAEPTQEPQVDMTTGITVHNGSRVNGLAGRTGDRLRNAGYTAVTVQPGVYSQDQPSVTTVFYAGPEQQATAQAIAQSLGIATVEESAAQAQSNPIVIVLRSDFQE